MGDLGSQEQQAAQELKPQATQKAGSQGWVYGSEEGRLTTKKLKMDSEDQSRPTLSATCAISRPSRESEPKMALVGALPS